MHGISAHHECDVSLFVFYSNCSSVCGSLSKRFSGIHTEYVSLNLFDYQLVALTLKEFLM